MTAEKRGLSHLRKTTSRRRGRPPVRLRTKQRKLRRRCLPVFPDMRHDLMAAVAEAIGEVTSAEARH